MYLIVLTEYGWHFSKRKIRYYTAAHNVTISVNVPHRLFEAGLEVGHVLDVLSTWILVRRHDLSDLLQQLLLGAGVS